MKLVIAFAAIACLAAAQSPAPPVAVERPAQPSRGPLMPDDAQSTVPASAASQTPSFSPQYILGTGIGFHPYQTPIKAGSSGYLSFAAKLTDGTYSISTLDLTSAGGQFRTGIGRVLVTQGNYTLMAYVDAGISADANNVASAFSGGGYLLYDVSKFSKSEHTYVGAQISVTKAGVPAPVQGATLINPVQPYFAVGIFKTF